MNGEDDELKIVRWFEEQMEKITLWWGLDWTHAVVCRVVDGML